MDIPLAENDWESTSENIPRIKLHNMYIAEDPASPSGKTRVSRMTLKHYITMPSGICYGAWSLDGALGSLGGSILGKGLVVYGTTLYLIDTQFATATSLGSIPGTGYCEFAGTIDRVLILRDGTVYSTDGATVTTVTMPDSDLVGSIATINSYFLLSVAGSNRFYWITPGGTDPDPLDFASAERYPDPIISIGITSDEIWLIGSKGPEVWQSTGDSNAPFERIPARDYSEGCISPFTMVNIVYSDTRSAYSVHNDLPALMWVTPQGAVVIAQGVTHRASNESVEEKLRTVTDPSSLRAFFFRYNRHDFYVLTADDNEAVPGFTLVYDLTLGNWCRWDTYLLNLWQAQLGFQVGSSVYVGDAFSNNLWILEEGFADDGVQVVREISGGVFNTGKPYSCNDVIVRVNAGWAPDYVGEPQIEMRWSDDQGATWSTWSQGTGLKGQYLTDVVFRSLGLIVRPGRLFEWRFTDFARIRFDYATLNEADG
jgi:hypothetical protein